MLKCPFCENQMENGYIPFNTPFILKWVSSSKSKKIRVSSKIKLLEVSKIENVYYCENCNLFVKK